MPKAIPPGGYSPGKLNRLPKEMATLKDRIMGPDEVETKHLSFELGTRLFQMGDDIESYTWLKDGANDGNVEAAYECGFTHYMGIGARREQNLRLAKTFFVKASEGGHARAQFFLGEIYEAERRHPQLAADEYEKAAAQGHTRAHFMLGKLLMRGMERGEEPKAEDVAKGRAHLEAAADLGHVKAKVALAGLCEADDEPRAISLYTAAARADDDIAQRKVATYFKAGVVKSCPSNWRAHLYNASV